MIHLYDIYNVSPERFVRSYYLSKIVVQLNQQLSMNYNITLDKGGWFSLSLAMYPRDSQRSCPATDSPVFSPSEFLKKIILKSKTNVLLISAVIVIMVSLTAVITIVSIATGAANTEHFILIVHILYFINGMMIITVFGVLYIDTRTKRITHF